MIMKQAYFDKAVGLKNLVAVRDILQDAGIRMFLHWGTLLGAVRERDFIPHDNDIDVGFYLADLDKFLALRSEFEKRGFEFMSGGEISNRKDGYIYKVIRDGVDVDLFPAREVRRLFRGRLWQLDERTTVSSHFLDSLQSTIFLGETFSTPADPIGLMRNLYGKTWNVPIADYPARVDWRVRLGKFLASPTKIPFYTVRFATTRIRLFKKGRKAR